MGLRKHVSYVQVHAILLVASGICSICYPCNQRIFSPSFPDSGDMLIGADFSHLLNHHVLSMLESGNPVQLALDLS